MKKILALAVCLLLCLPLIASCGADSPAVGTWTGKWCKCVGDEEKITDEAFSLELKKNGEGTSTRDGETYNLTWELDGEAFKMTETFLGMKLEYTGTLKDGELHLYNGDPEDPFTYEYVYSK